MIWSPMIWSNLEKQLLALVLMAQLVRKWAFSHKHLINKLWSVHSQKDLEAVYHPPTAHICISEGIPHFWKLFVWCALGLSVKPLFRAEISLKLFQHGKRKCRKIPECFWCLCSLRFVWSFTLLFFIFLAKGEIYSESDVGHVQY